MTSTPNLENGTTTDVTGDGGVFVSCSWAENGPNLTDTHDALNLGYEAHSHLFATAYFIMLLYALYAIFRTIKHANKRLQTRKCLGVSLHATIAVTSFTRSLSLFLDPYGLSGFIPCPYNTILWSFGWPGVVSSYSIFFLAVLESTNLSIVSPRYQRLSILLAIIAISLGYVIFTDLLVSFIQNSIISIILREVMFIVWGFSLTVGFVYLWWKVRKNLASSCPRNARERRRSSLNGLVVAAAKSEMRRLNRLISILIFSALICLVLTLSHVEPIIDLLHSSGLDFSTQPWQWIAYQTGQRALEVSMCVVIMIAMSKSSRDHRKKTAEKETVDQRIAHENRIDEA